MWLQHKLLSYARMMTVKGFLDLFLPTEDLETQRLPKIKLLEVFNV